MASHARGARSQLRDEAAAYVREQIAVGEAPPGSHLPLELLASTIGMSVTPVREALLLLAQDGIVVQEPNRGFSVASIRRKDIGDTYIVYARVAGELAARAATRIEDQEIARLRKLDERMRALGTPREYERIEDDNYTFHEVVYDAARSPRLKWFVVTSARFVPRRLWAVVPGWLEWNRTSHAPLIEALARRDPIAARTAMEEHALGAADVLIAHFDARDLWQDG
jgi:DNA-binding GntR family transcriptional regulator